MKSCLFPKYYLVRNTCIGQVGLVIGHQAVTVVASLPLHFGPLLLQVFFVLFVIDLIAGEANKMKQKGIHVYTCSVITVASLCKYHTDLL